MSKKILLSSTLIALVVVLIIACIFLYPRVFYSRSFESLTGLKISDYDKIIITNGNNGKRAEITDPAQIERILSNFYDTKLRTNLFKDKRKGWTFSIAIYNKGVQVAFVIDSKVYITKDEKISEEKTQYELKTIVPHDVVDSIYKEYGIQSVYEGPNSE